MSNSLPEPHQSIPTAVFDSRKITPPESGYPSIFNHLNTLVKVKLSGFRSVETEDGDKYVRLILSSDPEMDNSKNTDNFYETNRRTSIS